MCCETPMVCESCKKQDRNWNAPCPHAFESTTSPKKALYTGFSVKWEFAPRDLWLGLYWKKTHRWALDMDCFDVWLCLIPCFPIHFCLIKTEKNNG